MPGENHRNDEEAPPPPPSEEPQLRFALQFHVGAIALLETLCLLFTISTISSTCEWLLKCVDHKHVCANLDF